MIADLILEYSIVGGRPPDSNEYLRIEPDGSVLCIVGNAWPEGQPQDEAGLYRMKLAPAEWSEISEFLLHHRIAEMNADFGPRPPDSGFNFLRLSYAGREKTITWSMFAEVPEMLEELHLKVRRMIQAARLYPEQVVSASLGLASARVKPGGALNLEARFSNRGSRPIRLVLQSSQLADPLHIFAATAEQVAETGSVVTFYRHARSIPLENPNEAPAHGGKIELPPGRELRLQPKTPFILEKSGSYHVYGFAEPQIELVMENGPVLLPCFLLTRPVAVRAERMEKGTRS
jgi:hypothetical protein